VKLTVRPRQRALLGQLGDLDLRLLRVFRIVADCGGLAAAELELNIGISTVSRHVKDLEIRLGLRLCRRGRGGFALTTEGERVYREISHLLASVESFRGSIDDIHQRMGGQLELAVFDKTASNPQSKIHEAMARFSDEAPEVRLSVHVSSIGGIERGIIDGKFHVGVIPSHRNSKSIDYADLFGETMFLYCAAGHPLFDATYEGLTWRRIRKHGLAGLGYHSPNMQISHRERLQRKATGNDQEAIATLVLSGRYLGFLPDHYAQSFVQDGRMRAIAPERLYYSCRFVSVLRRSPEPTRAIRLFWKHLLAVHQQV
jgi:LysR family transcriptional regulator, transcriptional activator for bauABCD operon